MKRATIHRPNLGSLAYVWIGDREHVTGATSEAHALLRRHGTPIHTHTTRHGGESVEHYIIERNPTT